MASEAFRTAFSYGGSLVIDCGFCNRVHFSVAENDYEERELEGLLEAQEKNPVMYVSHNEEYISHGSLNGHTYVHGCPCEETGADKYEAFIWKHRDQILSYLTARVKKELAEARLRGEPLERAAGELRRILRNLPEK